jgi:hypothetical protein
VQASPRTAANQMRCPPIGLTRDVLDEGMDMLRPPEGRWDPC